MKFNQTEAYRQLVEDQWHIQQGREQVAKLARADGEETFAREVQAGCWDHRNDVQHFASESLVDRVRRLQERLNSL